MLVVISDLVLVFGMLLKKIKIYNKYNLVYHRLNKPYNKWCRFCYYWNENDGKLCPKVKVHGMRRLNLFRLCCYLGAKDFRKIKNYIYVLLEGNKKET